MRFWKVFLVGLIFSGNAHLVIFAALLLLTFYFYNVIADNLMRRKSGLVMHTLGNTLFFVVFNMSLTAGTPAGVHLLTADSLRSYPNYIKANWRFAEGDDPARAAVNYDDSKWEVTRPYLEITDTTKEIFGGLGWFRLHVFADTTVTGVPLALTMSHYGASEIYIDGKLVKSYGLINGPDKSEYFDPRELPVIFTLNQPGEHVLAVRYANYDAQINYDDYIQRKAGFEMMIGLADDFIEIKNQRSTIITFFTMLLGGIFLAISVIHLFLYSFHRSDRSNLYFSIFMISIAALFALGFIKYTSTAPSFSLKSMFLINPVILVACLSLSGFIRELYSKKNWRLLVILLLAVVSFVIQWAGNFVFAIFTLGLIIAVSLEAAITIIYAIVKGVKGTSIIGTGILFFALFFLTLFAVAVINGGNFDIDDSTVSGRIWELFMALSVISIPVSMSLYQAWRFASINKDLEHQLVQVKLLSQKTLEQEQEKKRILETQKEKLEEEVQLRTAELRSEKKKSDDLLLNILPAEVADELKEKGSTAARQFEEVTVLFTDFKNFTLVSERLTAQELVNEINYCYSEFDKIISRHGIEKIKTIGDAYMCAGGLPVPVKDNAMDTVKAAMEILEFMTSENQKRKAAGHNFFEIRIGVHTGPVVAGIVGIKKFAYDIWGDTVNIASRMESSGETGKVNVSGATYELIKDYFACSHRGKIQAKNKGEIDMYFVDHKL